MKTKRLEMGKQLIFYDMAALMSVIVVTLLLAVRIHFSIGLSDESIYLADPYFVTKGMVPYVNGWLNASGFSLFTAPVQAIHMAVTNGTEGLFLFQRWMYVFTKLFFFLFEVRLLMPYFTRSNALFLLLPTLAWTQGIQNFSYNDYALWLSMLSSILLFVSIMQSDKKKYAGFLAGLGGVAIALCTFTYPSAIIICIMYFVLMIVLCKVLGIGYCTVISYFIGGITTAGILTGYLILAGGGVSKLVFGLETLVHNNLYFQIVSKDPVALIILQLKQAMRESTPFIVAWIGTCVVTLIIICCTQMHPLKICCANWKKYILITLVIAYVLFCFREIFQIIFYGKYFDFLYLALGAFLTIIMLFFIDKPQRKTLLLLFLFVWGGSFALVFVSGFNFGGIRRKFLFFIAGASLLSIFAEMAIKHAFEAKKKPSFFSSVLPKSCSIIISLVLTLTYMIHNFYIPYNERPIWDLHTKVPAGVYKGVYTTSIRSEGLVQAENEIKRHISPNDRVLFLDIAGFGYVAAQAQPVSPTGGDINAYRPRVNDPSFYYRYMEQVERMPDKIVYLDCEGKGLSIDDESWLFNAFVQENYIVSYENRDNIFPIVIYSNKT